MRPTTVDLGSLCVAGATWLASAVPMILTAITAGSPPFWPDFGPDSTIGSIALWVTFAGGFYLTPVALISMGAKLWSARGVPH